MLMQTKNTEQLMFLQGNNLSCIRGLRFGELVNMEIEESVQLLERFSKWNNQSGKQAATAVRCGLEE